MKYILPHAKTAAIRTFSDVATNRQSIKEALKSNGIGFLKNVGSDIIKSGASSQSGKGIISRGLKRRSTVLTQLSKLKLKKNKGFQEKCEKKIEKVKN